MLRLLFGLFKKSFAKYFKVFLIEGCGQVGERVNCSMNGEEEIPVFYGKCVEEFIQNFEPAGGIEVNSLEARERRCRNSNRFQENLPRNEFEFPFQFLQGVGILEFTVP